jgi:hypothetical protein
VSSVSVGFVRFHLDAEKVEGIKDLLDLQEKVI